VPQSANGIPLVFIGKDSCGNWVVQEHCGLFGGLFANRIDAVRYALFENGHHPERIIELPTIIELDMNSQPVLQRLERVRRRA
jgi:hypothetical protein